MNKKRGRPNLYFENVQPRIKEIKEWVRAGATNAEIASALNIGLSNYHKYLNEYVELRDAVKEARLSGVPSVKMALYKRAIGFEYEEKKISMRKDEDGVTRQYVETLKKYALPDVGAIQTFLRNNTDEFRDRDYMTNDFKKMEIELRKKALEEW